MHGQSRQDCEIVQNPARLPLVKLSKLDDSLLNETYAQNVESLNNVVLKTRLLPHR